MSEQERHHLLVAYTDGEWPPKKVTLIDEYTYAKTGQAMDFVAEAEDDGVRTYTATPEPAQY